MNVIFLEPARDEFKEAIEYYESQREGLGWDFEAKVDDVINHIKQFPKAASRLEDEIWRRRTQRFPYGVIYHVRDDSLIIIAIMHLRRKPGYWRARLSLLNPPPEGD